ncbi:IS66 family transposase [Sorangium sp. So ce1128]
MHLGLVPSTPFYVATQYAINQEAAWRRCFTDGRFEIDNGEVERRIRCVALGRNYAELSVMRRDLPNRAESRRSTAGSWPGRLDSLRITAAASFAHFCAEGSRHDRPVFPEASRPAPSPV